MIRTKRHFPPRLILMIAPLWMSGCMTRSVLKTPLEARSRVRDPDFSVAMGSILGGALVGGNRVTTLVNGDQIFPAMLRAIRSAKKTITFETFVF